MTTVAKRTPLFDRHATAGAKMAEFSGYEMPLWFSSAKREHLAVLTHAGLFDTSHMAALTLRGSGAFDLLQRCFTKDLAACLGPRKKELAAGRCVYGIFLDERGHTIDDAIVFRLAEAEFMVVVNAGMGPVIAGHLAAHRGDASVDIADLTDRLGKIDIQGPQAARILARVLENPREVLQDMVYFSFKGGCGAQTGTAGRVRLADGTPLLLSRTGYTGEFGFELFLDPGRTKAVWDALLEAGLPSGMLACGLAARDSLRTGAVLPLAHQDIGPWPFRDTPWGFALPYNDDVTGFTKSFVGDRALNDARASQYTQPFVGRDLRKVTTSDPAVVKDAEGRVIGVVTTCTTDMGIDRHAGRILSVSSPDVPPGFQPKGLSCGFLRVETKLAAGQVVQMCDRRRTLEAVIVEDIRPHRTARSPMAAML